MFIIKCKNDDSSQWCYFEATNVSVDIVPTIEAYRSCEYKDILHDLKIDPDYIFVSHPEDVNPVMARKLSFQEPNGNWNIMLFNCECYLLSDKGKTIDRLV